MLIKKCKYYYIKSRRQKQKKMLIVDFICKKRKKQKYLKEFTEIVSIECACVRFRNS